MDPAGPDHAERPGRPPARLHSLTPKQAEAAGVEARAPARVRQAWRDDVARVSEACTVLPTLTEAWQAWREDDTCWLEQTVMTHGESHPAHRLSAEEGTVTGVLDWTTARVDDPAHVLSAQYGAAGEEMLRAALTAYEQAGGHVRPGLAARAKQLWDASPIGYALHALTTGAETGLATAAAVLNPEACCPARSEDGAFANPRREGHAAT